MIDTPLLAKSKYLSSIVLQTAGRTVWSTNDHRYFHFGQIRITIVVRTVWNTTMIDTPLLAKSKYLSSLVFQTASWTVWNTNNDRYF